ncbi:unnamed protein product, partial [Mesorhabditis spiculigera]
MEDGEEKKRTILEKMEARQRALKEKREQRAREVKLGPDFEAIEQSFRQGVDGQGPSGMMENFGDFSSIGSPRPSIVAMHGTGPNSSTPFARAPQQRRFNDADFKTPSLPQHKIQATPRQKSPEYLTPEQTMKRHFKAISGWANSLLRSGLMEEEDHEAGTESANKELLRMLKQGRSKKVEAHSVRPKYIDWAQRQQEKYRKKSQLFFDELEIKDRIKQIVSQGETHVRGDLKLFLDVNMQYNIMQILFSFQPLWLHLGFAVVFQQQIQLNKNDSFKQKFTHFCMENLFISESLLKPKRNTQGGGGNIRLTTPEGTRALHDHLLRKLLSFFAFVEEAKKANIIARSPGIFVRTSKYKSLPDVFSECSRLFLASTPLQKVLKKAGFDFTFIQPFYESYRPLVTSFEDLGDGVLLGRLVEYILGMEPNTLMCKLRNPCGDRLRKIGNVSALLNALKDHERDIGALTASKIVGLDRPSILELLWRLVGYYMAASRATTSHPRAIDVGSPAETDQDVRDDLLHRCRQFGAEFGVEVKCYRAIRDGSALVEIWNRCMDYRPAIDDFPGATTWDKISSAAHEYFDMPACMEDDDRTTSLFVAMLFERLKECHDDRTILNVPQEDRPASTEPEADDESTSSFDEVAIAEGHQEQKALSDVFEEPEDNNENTFVQQAAPVHLEANKENLSMPDALDDTNPSKDTSSLSEASTMAKAPLDGEAGQENPETVEEKLAEDNSNLLHGSVPLPEALVDQESNKENATFTKLDAPLPAMEGSISLDGSSALEETLVDEEASKENATLPEALDATMDGKESAASSDVSNNRKGSDHTAMSPKNNARSPANQTTTSEIRVESFGATFTILVDQTSHLEGTPSVVTSKVSPVRVSTNTARLIERSLVKTPMSSKFTVSPQLEGTPRRRGEFYTKLDLESDVDEPASRPMSPRSPADEQQAEEQQPYMQLENEQPSSGEDAGKPNDSQPITPVDVVAETSAKEEPLMEYPDDATRQDKENAVIIAAELPPPRDNSNLQQLLSEPRTDTDRDPLIDIRRRIKELKKGQTVTRQLVKKAEQQLSISNPHL